jgi:hypothetical protein
LVQFLIHRAQLPDSYAKTKSCALIPVSTTGTIFTNGFAFDLPLLTMMMQCELKGYPVVYPLLRYHASARIEGFVKRAFLQPHRQSLLFIVSVLGCRARYSIFGDPEVVEGHAGSLVLIALSIQDERLEEPKEILARIALTNPQAQEALADAPDLHFVLNSFQFAIEQLIGVCLEMLNRNPKFNVVKAIVYHLRPWVERLRLLPNHSFIIQGIPAQYQRFQLTTFFRESHDVFAELWQTMLRSADNNVVVLLCLFECDDAVVKEQLFAFLLEHEPLSSRATSRSAAASRTGTSFRRSESSRSPLCTGSSGSLFTRSRTTSTSAANRRS